MDHSRNFNDYIKFIPSRQGKEYDPRFVAGMTIEPIYFSDPRAMKLFGEFIIERSQRLAIENQDSAVIDYWQVYKNSELSQDSIHRFIKTEVLKENVTEKDET